jgi:hypothetical protein
LGEQRRKIEGTNARLIRRERVTRMVTLLVILLNAVLLAFVVKDLRANRTGRMPVSDVAA